MFKKMCFRFGLAALVALMEVVIVAPRQFSAATEPVYESIPPLQNGCVVDETVRQTRYELNAVLDWNSKVLQVSQTVHYRNEADTAIQELVFHSEPHRLSRANTMNFRGAIRQDGTPLNNATIDNWRITVPLGQTVESGCEAVVVLLYDITIAPLSDSNPVGWLAYTERQVNIGHWFPTIGVYGYEVEGEWYTPTRHYIGEQSVPEIADYRASLQVNGAPAGLQMAAPGNVSQSGNTWDIELLGARDLAVSLSTSFVTESVEVDGVILELYHFAESRSSSVAQAVLDAQQAISLYNELFGRYPHERLVVVEGDFDDGYEFSGLVFVAAEWFEIWDRTPQHWLNVITIHEIAHQWWYMQVANHQGDTPYLDEALATYSELLYYERYHPDLVQQWWDWRVLRYNLGDAPVDSTVYDYTQWRPYINAVYLRGVLMLRDIRAELGDEVFFAWLRDYLSHEQNLIARPADFWGVLDENSYLALQQIRSAYLRQPNILSE